jgi:hypothetical protein
MLRASVIKRRAVAVTAAVCEQAYSVSVNAFPVVYTSALSVIDRFVALQHVCSLQSQRRICAL